MILRRCCFCFDIRAGSVVVASVRLISWLVIFTAAAYVWLHMFSLHNGGMFHYRARVNIEENCEEGATKKMVTRFLLAKNMVAFSYGLHFQPTSCS